MNRTIRNFLRVPLLAALLTLTQAQPASAQIPVTDLAAVTQRIENRIAEGINFAIEIESMTESLLTATGQLAQARALAEQMQTVYKKVSGVITKGREIYNLYRTIEDTYRLVEDIKNEYDYYSRGGQLSASRVRRMRYIVTQIANNAKEVTDYVSNTLLRSDSGTSAKDKKDDIEQLDKKLKGNNAAARELMERDQRDMQAAAIAQIEQQALKEMGFGNSIAQISDEDDLRTGGGGGLGGLINGGASAGALLPAIDWSRENGSDAPDGTVPTQDNLPKDKLFRVVYILEGVITILMAPIAYWRKNKGEGNAQDALLKVVFGFFFAVILTTIVQGAFFM